MTTACNPYEVEQIYLRRRGDGSVRHVIRGDGKQGEVCRVCSL